MVTAAWASKNSTSKSSASEADAGSATGMADARATVADRRGRNFILTTMEVECRSGGLRGVGGAESAGF